MARKSRYRIDEITNITKVVIYNTAVYARLSSEDRDFDSIDNQILLIENYIKGNQQLRIIDRYSDNGLSGRTFERDGFRRMIEDIKARKINCVVVKDLSRFARNYIEACEYLEKIFPFMGVRFISVNDGFDSYRDDPTDIIIMLKNLINHEYSKDLSRKVNAVFASKRKNGEFMATHAPYGYKKSGVNKNTLEIDEETAPIICDIFKWKSEGTGNSIIAQRLNNLNIPSPAQRLRDKGALKIKKNMVTSLWNSTTISNILKNSVYIGHMIQGRSKAAIYDGKLVKVKNPESDWDIVNDTHPAIIGMELWNCVQTINEQRRSESLSRKGNRKVPDETENVYRGLIICGQCGGKMYRQKENGASGKITYRFLCQLRRQQGASACSIKTIRERDINNIVHKIISEEIQRSVNVEAIIEDLSKEGDKRKTELSNQIALKDKRISRLRVLRMSLVESLAARHISEADFTYAKAMYETEESELRQDMDELEIQLKDESLSAKNRWLVSFKRFMDEKAVTREMAVTLIERIVAHDNEHIDVHMNFRSDYEKLREFVKKGGEV